MMAKSEYEKTNLLSELPTREFVIEPEELDRLVVRIWSDGTIHFKGTRPRIEEFLQRCADTGLQIQVDYITRCG